MSTTAKTRLEKAAADNGFDLAGPPQGDWIYFRSSHSPLRVWLKAQEGGLLVAALSRSNVLEALEGFGSLVSNKLPEGACGARSVADFATLHRLVRRAFQLSRTLPDELLRVFQSQTATFSRSTEVERFIIQRVGQDIFRRGLLEYWDNRCAITELAVPELLRASHIKPWADCENDAERLDIFNGFLLAPHLDAVFDAGLITIGVEGEIVVSELLGKEARGLLGLDQVMKLRGVTDEHQRYLVWHRNRVFRQIGSAQTRIE
jgi:putative restriction endonuclease